MPLHKSIAVVAVTAVALVTAAEQVVDLSGAWHLNVEKSRWGKHPKPHSVVVNIVHNEPALKYSGIAVAANGEDTREFSFEGAIDGKEYLITGAFGEGKIAIRRVSPTTTASVFKSNDGNVVETATTTVSADGRTLRREIKVKGPEGEMSWTEIYERR